MPGQLKEVRNRIKSVQNTQQITKAMKMVSAAKLRRATDRILKMRPYANKMQEILSNIASGSGVNIALGNTLLAFCGAFDPSFDGAVTIDDLTVAVNHGIAGCAPSGARHPRSRP